VNLVLRTGENVGWKSVRLCQTLTRLDPSFDVLVVGGAESQGSVTLIVTRPAGSATALGSHPLTGYIGILRKAKWFGTASSQYELPFDEAPQSLNEKTLELLWLKD
jgi:hypothetical protein